MIVKVTASKWLIGLALCVLLLLNIFGFWGVIRGFEVVRTISPFSMNHDTGFAYVAGLRQRTWPFRFLSDDTKNPRVARTAMLEDGRELGPPHSIHETIRKKGVGGYSHWNTFLLFSTSDNSDPRTNGRLYQIRANVAVSPIFLILVFLAITLLIKRLNLPWKSTGSVEQIERILGKINLPMFRNIWLILIFIILYAAPGPDTLIFSGIPLSGPLEVFILLSVLGYFFALYLTQSLTYDIVPGFWLVAGILIATIALKFFFFFDYSPEKFEMCLKHPRLQEIKCELSANHVFKKRDFTQLDNVIDYGKDLVHPSQNRYLIYQNKPGSIVLGRYPQTITWSGRKDFPTAGNPRLIFRYSGSVAVTLNDVTVNLPVNYGSVVENTLNIAKDFHKSSANAANAPPQPLPQSSEKSVLIVYNFDDGSRVGSVKPGPRPNVSVYYESDSVAKTLLTADAKLPAGKFPAQFHGIIDLWIAFILLVFASTAAALVLEYTGPLAVLLVPYAFSLIHVSPDTLMGRLLLTDVSPYVLLGVVLIFGVNGRKNGLVPFLLAALTIGYVMGNHAVNFQQIKVFASGEDPRTYEGFARTMLDGPGIYEFFRGGRSLFYFQPFYRYCLAVAHILFGDSYVAITLFWKYLYILSIASVFVLFRNFGRIGAGAAIFLCFFYNAIIANFVWHDIEYYLSEPTGILFVITGLYLLFEQKSSLARALGFTSLGLAVITRINFAPGVWVIMAAFFLFLIAKEKYVVGRRLFLAVVLFGGVAAAVYSVVPIHNYVYGDKILITTGAATISATLATPVYSGLFSGEESQDQALRRLSLIMYLKNKYSETRFVGNEIIRFYMNALLLLYGILIIYHVALAIRRRRSLDVFHLAFLLIPAGFLSLYLFYAVERYYPNHIMNGHIMLYLVTVMIAGLDCAEIMESRYFGGMKDRWAHILSTLRAIRLPFTRA